MSNDIVWDIVSKRSCFLVKRKNPVVIFSGEKGNLRNVNTKKFSGLANDQVVDIRAPLTKRRGVNFGFRPAFRRRWRKPRKQFTNWKVKKGSFERMSKIVAQKTKQHRPELVKASLERMAKMKHLQKRRK